MNLFYCDPSGIANTMITISGQEANHMTRVLRNSVGDKVFVTDGRGILFHCEIRSIQKNEVYLDVINSENRRSTGSGIILCMGYIKKRDRLEFAVEKTIELGADHIIIFHGDHSQKGNIRRKRLESRALSAMKQSLRCILPKISIENSLREAVQNHISGHSIIVADETVQESNQRDQNEKSLILIVGPEGGFSENERDFLMSEEAVFVSLGNNRLRTETAAIVMTDRYANLK